MIRIVPLAAVFAALIGGLAAPVAQATFPGGNGVVAGGWQFSSDGGGGGRTSDVVSAIRAFGAGGRFDIAGDLLVGCRVTSSSFEELRDRADRSFLDPSFSATGDAVAFSTGWSIGIADLSDGSVSHLPNPRGRAVVRAPAFSPDGRQVAFAVRSRPRGIWITSIDGSRQEPLTTGSAPDWSSSGWIAFSRGNQIFRIRPDGTGLRQLTGRGGFSPSWAPGGRKLAFLRPGGVYALDVPTGTLVREVPDRAFGWPAFQVRWSPDGGSFAILGESLTRWDRRRGSSTELLHMVDGSYAEYQHHLNGIAWQPLR